MSHPQAAPAAFLWASFLYNKDKIDLAQIQNIWESKFGESIHFSHDYFPMKGYYTPEMGENLGRFFLVSPKLYNTEDFVDTKHWSYETESKFRENDQRALNIDVGLITLNNLQLATFKNFTHRIYIGKGVYSDLTLMFQGNSYQKLEWSYPDYAHEEIIEFFNWTRSLLQVKLTY